MWGFIYFSCNHGHSSIRSHYCHHVPLIVNELELYVYYIRILAYVWPMYAFFSIFIQLFMFANPIAFFFHMCRHGLVYIINVWPMHSKMLTLLRLWDLFWAVVLSYKLAMRVQTFPRLRG